MEVYKIPIEFAFIAFPFIAFILTIPFLIHQYRKYGAIPLLKSAIFYSMILYLICAYFLVMLPLPSIEEVSKMTGPTTQLTLFQFIKDIMSTANFDIVNLQDIIKILKSPTVYTVLFNIILTLPFGVYLRYFFNKKWYQSLIYTFILSLFFELTQLSGLYGIYPRPYRLFDVDDLLINTLGGLIGHLITPLFTFFLPTRDELEEKSYKKGIRVTLLRRIIALSIDILFVAIFCLINKVLFYKTLLEEYYFLITITLYHVILPIFTSGQTLGKKFLRLKITTTVPEEKIKWYQLLFRNFLLTYIFVYPFSWISILIKEAPSEVMSRLYLVLITIQIINIIYYVLTIISKKEHLFLYEYVSKTKNISIINYPQTDNVKTQSRDENKNIIENTLLRQSNKRQRKNTNKEIEHCKN